jgi:hypothetical protein
VCIGSVGNHQEEEVMKGRKEADKKKGTLRPWLVDVVVDQLR